MFEPVGATSELEDDSMIEDVEPSLEIDRFLDACNDMPLEDERGVVVSGSVLLEENKRDDEDEEVVDMLDELL